MYYKFEILAIHNHLDRTPITWFSAFLRIITGCFHNHLAVSIIDPYSGRIVGVIEAIWPRVKWWDDYDEWLNHATRTVDVLVHVDASARVPAELIFQLIGKNYGILDLVQLLLVIINVIWRGKENYSWDGKKGTGLRPGIQCAELAYTIAQLAMPWLAIPGKAINHPSLVFAERFYTKKKSQQPKMVVAA